MDSGYSLVFNHSIKAVKNYQYKLNLFKLTVLINMPRLDLNYR